MKVKSNHERAVKKDTSIFLRVTEEVKKAADKKARDDCRPLAAYVYKILVEDLRASGHLK